MLSLIKRKNEASQAAADLEAVFRQACEQKIKNFKVFPENFFDNTYIVGFIAGVLEALIDLQCLKDNALWAMNSQKWPEKLKLNFQLNFIQNLDGYHTSLYHRSLLDEAIAEKLRKLTDFQDAKRYGFLYCALVYNLLPKNSDDENTKEQSETMKKARDMAQLSNNDYDVKTSLLCLTLWEHINKNWGENKLANVVAKAYNKVN